MKILNGLDQIQPGAPYPVLTIGNFDGVHRGHRALLRSVVSLARAQGGTAAVLTFDPHPLRILAPERAPVQIQTLDQRVNSIAAEGIDLLCLVPFTPAVARIGAEEFAAEYLARRMGVREFVVGRHFVFGRDREGDIEFLRRRGADMGFLVREVQEMCYRGDRISSTRVRALLAAGRVSLAARLMDRSPSLMGTVVHGSTKGRELGYPTANLEVANEMIPANGVYITGALVDGTAYPGLTNIGHRPTISALSEHTEQPVVETHLFDFSGDLYGRRVELFFHLRLRPEKRFPSARHLVEQIARDKKKAMRFFKWCESLTATKRPS
jgi:riboflavin kinase / FMN adenylyltransferase